MESSRVRQDCEDIISEMESLNQKISKIICSPESSKDQSFRWILSGRFVQESLCMIGSFKSSSWVGVFHGCRGMLESYFSLTLYIYSNQEEKNNLLEKWCSFPKLKAFQENIKSGNKGSKEKEDYFCRLYEKRKLEYISFWHSPLSVKQVSEKILEMMKKKHPNIKSYYDLYGHLSSITHPNSLTGFRFSGPNYPTTININTISSMKLTLSVAHSIQLLVLDSLQKFYVSQTQ